ncbi:HD domain-containing protein [Schlesneria paludicola]|uniref:HD domain-containing protein n=1 Tax=Schlesneria paludicola TaxID=360056 RepID=UPI00029A9594|nr:HD domain-containing protein [Schlesneria paludicola]
MTDEKLRRGIIVEAARMMYSRRESEYYRAKMKAAKRLCRGWVKPSELPSNAEIRDEIERMANLFEGESRFDRLREMRIEALRVMRLLEHCRPKIIGSTFTGHVRQGSDIDIHVFASGTDAVTSCLDDEGMDYHVERKRVRKFGEERLFTHIHVRDRYPIELTLYAPDKASFVFTSSITGKAMERATLAEFEQFLKQEYPDANLDDDLVAAEAAIDRFQVYRSLLVPLESVMQDRYYHPEGDVLYHLLQCYVLAQQERPYDEEFQLAALLHDVGKGLDKEHHVESGLEALEGHITARTAWLIEHHMAVHQIRDRSIGHRAFARLRASPDYDDLLLLGECDRGGRVCGAVVPDVDDALDELRELARTYG